jgi:hypothetical protein
MFMMPVGPAFSDDNKNAPVLIIDDKSRRVDRWPIVVQVNFRNRGRCD